MYQSTPARASRRIHFIDRSKFFACTVLVVLAVAVVLVSSKVTMKDGGNGHRYSRKVSNKKSKNPAMNDASVTDAFAFINATHQPPVVIALMNNFYFGERYERVVPGCTTGGKTGSTTLPCEFTANRARFDDSTALAFHIPGMTEEMLDVAAQQKNNNTKSQALVGVSMESAPNYPLLANKDFLSRFDLLATLVPPQEREEGGSRASDDLNNNPKRIWYPYYDDMFRRCWEAEGNNPAVRKAPSSSPPFSSSSHPPHLRENAIAYINSNCATKIGRDELVKEIASRLQPLGGVPLHSFGLCLTNLPRTARADSKIDTLRRYKFCVAIENSEDYHYVSEKVYDAFVAGCVPIYLGAPNVLEYVPHKDAIIDVRALGGAKATAEEIARLAYDDAAYAAKHAWRDRPETWSEGFKRLQSQTWRDGVGPFKKCDTMDVGYSDPHMRRQCAICRAVAEWRDSRWGRKRKSDRQKNSN